MNLRIIRNHLINSNYHNQFNYTTYSYVKMFTMSILRAYSTYLMYFDFKISDYIKNNLMVHNYNL
jgi:hypothetical protein